MTRQALAIGFAVGLLGSGLAAAAPKGDIPVDSLPPEVKAVIEDYVKLLRSAEGDPAKIAGELVKIAGGGLVNESGSALRGDVTEHALKKDTQNIKFYADPIVITRVNVAETTGHGFGASALKGKFYKVWIQKADPKNGMPAPIGVMAPEGHPTVKTPRIDTIGSL